MGWALHRFPAPSFRGKWAGRGIPRDADCQARTDRLGAAQIKPRLFIVPSALPVKGHAAPGDHFRPVFCSDRSQSLAAWSVSRANASSGHAPTGPTISNRVGP